MHSFSTMRHVEKLKVTQKPHQLIIGIVGQILSADILLSTTHSIWSKWGTRKPGHFLIYLFGVLRRFQHCTGHITMGSWKGRGNQYIEFIIDLYCKLPTNSKQLPAFPLEAMPGTEPRPQKWEARVLPLCHRGPQDIF